MYCGYCKGDLQGFLDEKAGMASLVCENCQVCAMEWPLGDVSEKT
jgi:hypothetical protein